MSAKAIQMLLSNIEGTSAGGGAARMASYWCTFPTEFAFVATTDSARLPIGRWIEYKRDGYQHPVFLVGRSAPYGAKGVLPGRLWDYWRVRRHKRGILSCGLRNVMAHAPEVLMAIQDWCWSSLCYCFPGVENPVEHSRFLWAQSLASQFDSRMFSALKKCQLILASADDRAIEALVGRSNGRIRREDIVKFPTRVDTRIFRPESAGEARARVGLSRDVDVVVFCGRLNRVKGWDLALEAFEIFQRTRSNAVLIFVGDGEDREALKKRAWELGIASKVHLVGAVPIASVPTFLSAADIVINTSHYEGWSQSILEALACGKPVVATDVSGVRDLIKSGVNGYIVKARDAQAIARAMTQARRLEHAADVSLNIVEHYSYESLRRDLSVLWAALA